MIMNYPAWDGKNRLNQWLNHFIWRIETFLNKLPSNWAHIIIGNAEQSVHWIAMYMLYISISLKAVYDI